MKTKRNIFIAFLLNLIFSIFEMIGGIFTGSIAISSDAIHDFGDAISIGLAYFLERLSDKKPNKNYTFGYARFSVLGGLVITVILLISSGIVIYNAILRIITPMPIDYDKMLIVALVGLVVNSVAAYFTHGKKSINQKAVNLHMLEDVFGWLAVLIGAFVMRFTNIYLIDPILSIILATFIIFGAIKNLIQIIEIFMIKTPKNIDINKLKEHVKNLEGVIDLHHVHVWTLDGEIRCATLHVVVNNLDSDIKKLVKNKMHDYGFSCVTIEMETKDENCRETSCNLTRHNNQNCHHH